MPEPAWRYTSSLRRARTRPANPKGAESPNAKLQLQPLQPHFTTRTSHRSTNDNPAPSRPLSQISYSLPRDNRQAPPRFRPRDVSLHTQREPRRRVPCVIRLGKLCRLLLSSSSRSRTRSRVRISVSPLRRHHLPWSSVADYAHSDRGSQAIAS
jgi:hypothetical protein